MNAFMEKVLEARKTITDDTTIARLVEMAGELHCTPNFYNMVGGQRDEWVACEACTIGALGLLLSPDPNVARGLLGSLAADWSDLVVLSDTSRSTPELQAELKDLLSQYKTVGDLRKDLPEPDSRWMV